MKSIKFTFLFLGILFSILPSAVQAQTGCYNKGLGEIICEGDTVYFKDGSATERIGTAKEVFTDGTIHIYFTLYGSTYETFREARVVSPEVPFNAGVHRGFDVHFRDGSNVHRSGEVEYVFFNGMTRILYTMYGSSYAIFRNISQIGYEVSCLSDLCTNDRVHFVDGSGVRRVGDIKAVYTDGYLKIY